MSNADLLKVLEKTSFKLLVLVGDVYQIESIQFGNWFSIIRSFIPSTSVFELTTPFRTKNESLLGFWNKVRNLDDDIAEVMARNGYSTVLDKTLFEAQGKDEIILCLNYDGLYGINNINRFLQSSNPSQRPRGESPPSRSATRSSSTRPNGSGQSSTTTSRAGSSTSSTPRAGSSSTSSSIDRSASLTSMVTSSNGWKARLFASPSSSYDTSDDDDDSVNTTVPFQVAYAVSIHKAQGLEYDSVKIVITDANEDDITHSIFYTAITRARERLRIFWTPETQQAVLMSLQPQLPAQRTSLFSLAVVASARQVGLDLLRDRFGPNRGLPVESLDIGVLHSITAADVVVVLERIVIERGRLPAFLRFDNGPEFVSIVVAELCASKSTEYVIIDPGWPWQNGLI